MLTVSDITDYVNISTRTYMIQS